MLLSLVLIGSRRNDSPAFDLIYGLAVGCLLLLYILWDRRYRHRWQQFRAGKWPQVQGAFLSGSGEVLMMLKGRSKTVAGYEAWIDYEYRYDDHHKKEGLYKRFFESKKEAEEFIKLIEGKPVTVRVSPRKSAVSRILDQDLQSLILEVEHSA